MVAGGNLYFLEQINDFNFAGWKNIVQKYLENSVLHFFTLIINYLEEKFFKIQFTIAPKRTKHLGINLIKK